MNPKENKKAVVSAERSYEMDGLFVIAGIIGIAIIVPVIAAIATVVSTAAFIQNKQDEE